MYEYDFFLSYRRAGTLPDWVYEVFVPMLTKYLDDEVDRDVRIFLDRTMEAGSYWPDTLADALNKSRFLIAILSAKYDSSPWCRSEWRTMSVREKMSGLPTQGGSGALILPIRYADGDYYSQEMKLRTTLEDFSEHNYTGAAFQATITYFELAQKVRSLARTLALKIDTAPAWCKDWPIDRVELATTQSMPYPRM